MKRTDTTFLTIYIPKNGKNTYPIYDDAFFDALGPDFPFDEIPKSRSPKKSRHTKDPAPIEFLDHPEEWVHTAAMANGLMFGGLSFIVSLPLCGLGGIPGWIYGYNFGKKVGTDMIENLLDAINEGHDTWAKNRAKAEKAAEIERKREEREKVLLFKRKAKEAMADPVFDGLVQLGFSNAEALAAVEATKGEEGEDLSTRMTKALRVLSKKN